MIGASQTAPPTRYRVVHPPDRQDGSGQGVVREFGISRTSAGSSHLSMAYGVVPAGVTSTRHAHPFETAVFVISGRARAYFGATDEEWRFTSVAPIAEPTRIRFVTRPPVLSELPWGYRARA